MSRAMRTPTKSSWYTEGLSFECTQCGNCCTGPPGYVWFNDHEAKEMAKYLGMDTGAFHKLYTHKINGRRSLNELKSRHGYDCVFLDRTDEGKAICRIYPVRPSQCRTWPFWNENLRSQNAWNRAATTCPGIDQGTYYPIEQIRIIRDNQPTG